MFLSVIGLANKRDYVNSRPLAHKYNSELSSTQRTKRTEHNKSHRNLTSKAKSLHYVDLSYH